MNHEAGGRDATPNRRAEQEPFFREAPGIVMGLERSLVLLSRDPQGGHDGRNDALAGLSLLSHRLYGSASLYGLNTIAELSKAIEAAVNQVAATTPNDIGESVQQLLSDAVAEAGAAVQRAKIGDQHQAPDSALLERLRALAESQQAENPDELVAELRRQALINPDVLEFFEPEAREQLDGLSAALAKLASGHDEAAVDTAFRLVHTLKGAALMVECDAIGKLAHEMENLLEQAQQRGVPLGKERLAVLEDTHDVLLAMVAALGGRKAPLTDVTQEMHRRLAATMQSISAAGAVPAPPPEPSLPDPTATHEVSGPTDAVSFFPPQDPVAPPSVEPSVEEAPVPEMPAAELVESEAAGAVRADQEFVDDPAAAQAAARRIRVSLARVDALSELAGQAKSSLVRLERLVSRLDEAQQQYAVSRSRLFDTVEAFERRGKDLMLSTESRDDETRDGEELAGEERDDAAADPLEADSDRELLETSELSLDGFSELELDRYDEVDVLMRQLAEISYDLGETQTLTGDLRREMASELERSTRLSRELQNSIRQTRLLSLGRLLERFRRRAERAAADVGKEVVVEVTGGDVEVDAAIVERLADPLLHLVSNAVVHGIEDAAARRVLGKPRHGSIGIHARVQGAFVEIEVEDDGRGIDVQALRQRAVESGLWSETGAEVRSDAEVQALIFERGMSTAHRVSDTAGRGIGMDVVRTTARDLNGEVRTETVEGVGTRFTLRLPVMVTATSALQLRVGRERFALPPVNVRRVLQMDRRRVSRRGDGEWVHLDGEELQVLRLADHLGIAPQEPPPTHMALLIVQPTGLAAAPIAVAVDELLGLEELVMQPLCSVLSGVVGFAGVTLNPDGQVVLVLDAAELRHDSQASSWPSAEVREEAVASKPRLLIADDSVSVRGVLARQLRAAGYEVVTAQDGEQALLELRSQHFDALITDIEMPRLNGFELLEIVRRRPVGYDLPVIVVTTRIGGRHRDLAERLGATAYFSKPINRSSLLEILGRVTERPSPDGVVTELGAGMEAS